MASVDEHGELNAARPAHVHQRVQRGAYRPAGKEHIVYQDDISVIDIKGQFRMADKRVFGKGAQIIAENDDYEVKFMVYNLFKQKSKEK